MATRKIKPEPAIKTWEKADEALKEIGVRTASVDRHQARANAKIDEIKDNLGEETMGDLARIARLEKDLEEFLEGHREELGDLKSKTLNFGAMGFRTSPPKLKLSGKTTWQKVVQKIQEMGFPAHWLRCPDPEADKDKIKNEATGEQMKEIGVRVGSDENFWYELDKTKIVNTQEI